MCSVGSSLKVRVQLCAFSISQLCFVCLCTRLFLLWQCLIGCGWITQSSGMSSVTSCNFNCCALYCQMIIPEVCKLFYIPPHKRVFACWLAVCQDCCASPGGWRSIWLIYPSCLVQSAVSCRPSEKWWGCRKTGSLEEFLKQILQMLCPLELSWKEKLKLIVS